MRKLKILGGVSSPGQNGRGDRVGAKLGPRFFHAVGKFAPPGPTKSSQADDISGVPFQVSGISTRLAHELPVRIRHGNSLGGNASCGGAGQKSTGGFFPVHDTQAGEEAPQPCKRNCYVSDQPAWRATIALSPSDIMRLGGMSEVGQRELLYSRPSQLVPELNPVPHCGTA